MKKTACWQTKKVSLLETLDRVLTKGVIINGDVTLSVADVDLVYMGLRILLASVETAEKMRWGYAGRQDKAGKEKINV